MLSSRETGGCHNFKALLTALPIDAWVQLVDAWNLWQGRFSVHNVRCNGEHQWQGLLAGVLHLS